MAVGAKLDTEVAVIRLDEKRSEKIRDRLRKIYRDHGSTVLMEYIKWKRNNVLDAFGVYINPDKINVIRVSAGSIDFYTDSVIVSLMVEYSSNNFYCEPLMELDDDAVLCINIKPLITECGC